jgi:probable F420-dependent oxidoreductase
MRAEPTVSAGRFPFRFGLGIPTSGPFGEPNNILCFAEAGERFGFDDLWFNDHFNFDPSRRSGSPGGTDEAIRDQDPNFFESITSAAIVAGRTRTIGVAIGGLVVPLRHPVILAKQIASLHELSGRRLTIAPGIGGGPKDFELMGKKFERRGKLLDENLAALHAIWSSEQPVSFAGETCSFKDAWLYPRPKDLRLWITGETEPALERTARWGSGWFSAYHPVEGYPEKVARLRELTARTGRDPDAIDTATIIFVCVADSRREALGICGPTLERRFRSQERGLAVSAVGSPAEVQEQLAARHRAGLRYLELRFWTHDPRSWLEMVERTSADVLPALRRLS